MAVNISKAYHLITKLQKKYGFKTNSKLWNNRKCWLSEIEPTRKKDPAPAQVEDWCLVDGQGERYKLPKTMLFMGREECDIVVRSESVDKRHAVITFDHYLNKFKIKDLTTANGTYVNDNRIHDQEYVTLEHMDSVRLGQDSMLYHMEEVREDKNSSDSTQQQTTMPSWATKELPPMTVAECKGCIAEQQISHTCTVQSEPSDVINYSPSHVLNTDQSDALPYNPHHVTHMDQSEAMHYNPHHVIQTGQSEAMHYNNPHHVIQTGQSEAMHYNNPHHVTHSNQSEAMHCNNPHHVIHSDQSEAMHYNNPHHHVTHSNQSEAIHYSPHHHVMHTDQSHYNHHPHAVQTDQYIPQHPVVYPDNNTSHYDNVENISYQEYMPQNVSKQSEKELGCNTWPRKRVRNLKNVTTLFAEELTNGTIQDDHAHRILRGESTQRDNLPPELETVKKATPLYGQPDWWGEDADPNDNVEDTSLQPSNVTVENKRESHQNYVNNTLNNHMEFVQELPSPDPKAGNSLLSHDPGGSVDSYDRGDNPRRQSDSSGGASMSFTVDFDEDIRKMNSAVKLSDFVPSKMRKSFRERKEKAMAKTKDHNSPDKSGSTTTTAAATPERGGKSVSKEGTPEREEAPQKIDVEIITAKRQKKAESEVTPPRRQKQVESEEMVTPRRQKKIDEIWESDSSSSTKGRRSTEVKRSSRSSYDSDKATISTRSTRSVDTDKVTTPRSTRSMETDKVTTRSSRVKDVDKVTTRPSKVKDIDKVAAVSARGTKTYVKRKSTSDQKGSPQCKEEDQIAAAAVLKMTENASYLIDKMFESTPSKSVSKTKSKTVADRFTEHAMYREAKQFDTGKCKDVGAPPPQLVPMKEGIEEEVKEVDEAIDNVSEAGTYTIDCDGEDIEEQHARESIDAVFGVSDESDIMSQCLVIDDKGSKRLDELRIDEPLEERFAKGEITLEDLEKEIGQIERRKTERSEGAGGMSSLQELKIIEDDENPRTTVPSDAPAWVTQWAALTNQKSRSKSGNMDAVSPSSVHSHSSDKDEKMFKKSAHGLRRRGTGRKLPSIPGESSRTSPTSSETSSRVSETTGSPSILTPHHGDTISSIDSGKHKAVTISSQVVSRYDGTDTESVSRTKFSSDNESVATSALTSVTKSETSSDRRSRTSRSVSLDSDHTAHSSRSGCSVGSMDTEILLRDTQTVMAAMEARMSSKSSSKTKESTHMNGANDSFSDNESMVAMVNGDDQFLKHTNYSSPRQNLAKMRTTTSAPPKTKAPLTRANSATSRLNAFRESSKRHSSGDVSAIVSDVLSETPTLTDTSEISFTRSNSKGKGKMTMTRPNRAFELRRARADGEEPTTPGSSISSSTRDSSSRGTSSMTTSSRPTPKSRFTDRTNDSARSEVSLGGQIVARSRNNARSTSDLLRRDGGRHSLRLNRANSSSDPVSSLGTDIRKTDIKSIKARLKNSTYGSGGLSVTGISSSSKTTYSSTSQSSTNRTNSPKSAEKAAWRRRKEYDPRKAVAEAKVKTKDSKTKADEIRILASKNSKMTRSASFTNTAELRRYRRDNASLSSTDEISSCTNSEVNDSFVDPSSERGFIPYSGRSHSSRLYQSSEDEELGMLVKSSQDLTRSLLAGVRYVSAFTPPPPKMTSPPSPPPPLALSLYKPRHSVDNGHSYNHIPPSRKHSLPSPFVQSYDNILVSSIYQLSLKLKSSTDKSLKRLKDHERIENGTAVSPMDEVLDQASGDMPGWSSANQELAAILNNLRKLEHHIHVMNKVLFPEEESDCDTPRMTGQEKQEYLQEIERIRGELAGFQPISTPEEAWKLRDGDESVESDCEELGVPEEFF